MTHQTRAAPVESHEVANWSEHRKHPVRARFEKDLSPSKFPRQFRAQRHMRKNHSPGGAAVDT